MPDGTVEQCFQAIKTVLEGIQSGSGYKNDVVRVYRTFEPILAEDLTTLETPALFLGRTPGRDADFSDHHADAGYSLTIPATVIGFLRRGSDNAEDEGAATKAEGFLSDIEQALMADPQFGTGQSAGARIQQSRILASDHGASWDDSGIFVEVRFEFYTVISTSNP